MIVMFDVFFLLELDVDFKNKKKKILIIIPF